MKKSGIGNYEQLITQKIVNYFALLFVQITLFVKKIVHLTCKQGDHTAIDHVGAVAESLSHLARAILGIHVDGGLHNNLVPFL